MNTRPLRALIASLCIFCFHAQAGAQLLGTADSFAVLAGTAVTNTGNSALSGNLGVSPGTAISGFPPGAVQNGSTYAGGPVAQQAEADLAAAYTSIAGETYTTDLSNFDLGGLVLDPGVYHFDSSASLNGALILDAEGNPNARFDFQIGSTLTTGTNASITVIDGGQCNVYWQVGSSATLGTGNSFLGHILAETSITVGAGTSIVHGAALAEAGSVTLDDNSITACATPEPMPICALGIGTIGLLLRRRRRPS